MSRPARLVRLEVERKFTPVPHLSRRLQANRERPPFKHICKLGQSTFEDTYYDVKDVLNSNGLYLRNRDGSWQAKIRVGGDHVNSRFEETDNRDEILRHVRRYIPEANQNAVAFGLPVFAQFTTFRSAWLADKRFSIVLDDTNFGHQVGEVELEHNLNMESDRQRDAVVDGMDQEIDAFMENYGWAFKANLQQPTGKLSAYLAQAPTLFDN